MKPTQPNSQTNKTVNKMNEEISRALDACKKVSFTDLNYPEPEKIMNEPYTEEDLKYMAPFKEADDISFGRTMAYRQAQNKATTFTELCELAFDFISSGGLSYPEYWMQVSPLSHPLLAHINRSGFVTYNSQDAISHNRINSGCVERPYICGLMKRGCLSIMRKHLMFKLHDLIVIEHTTMKITKDNYPMLSQFCPPENHVPVTFIDHPLSKNNGFLTYYMHFINDGECLMRRLGGKQKAELVSVCIIDTRWDKPATDEDGLFSIVARLLDEINSNAVTIVAAKRKHSMLTRSQTK